MIVKIQAGFVLDKDILRVRTETKLRDQIAYAVNNALQQFRGLVPASVVVEFEKGDGS